MPSSYSIYLHNYLLQFPRILHFPDHTSVVSSVQEESPTTTLPSDHPSPLPSYSILLSLSSSVLMLSQLEPKVQPSEISPKLRPFIAKLPYLLAKKSIKVSPCFRDLFIDRSSFQHCSFREEGDVTQNQRCTSSRVSGSLFQ